MSLTAIFCDKLWFLSSFLGAKCETRIRECDSSPCRHNGTCSDLPGRYECQCPTGMLGCGQSLSFVITFSVIAVLAVEAGGTADLLKFVCSECGLRSSARAPLAISVYAENQRWLAFASGVPRLWHILPEEVGPEKSAWLHLSHESYFYAKNIFQCFGYFHICKKNIYSKWCFNTFPACFKEALLSWNYKLFKLTIV